MKIFAGLVMQKTVPGGPTITKHLFTGIELAGRTSVSRSEVLALLTGEMPEEVKGGAIVFFCADNAEITAKESNDEIQEPA